jgi:hypothetical protein
MQIENLISAKAAPRGALCPMRINREGLFQLDVDDDEWEMTLSMGAPLWLTHTGV